MQNVIEAAKEYKRRGWNPLPLRPGQKRPTGSAWQRTVIPDNEIEQVFAGNNIGVSLGTEYGLLYDADLDHEATVKMRKHFMPKTPAIFGRPSKPESHLFYQGMPDDALKRVTFKDSDGTMLAELRGNGNQTMVPPSLHPSGEPITWNDPTALPAIVPVEKTIKALGWLSAAAMIVRNWDSWADQHHVIMGALAGGFARSKVQQKIAEQFVKAICIYTGDHEPDDRLRMVLDTYRLLEENPSASVTGFTALREYIGSDRVNKIIDWCKLKKIDGDDALPTLTDDGNARRLVEMFGDNIRFVHEWNSWLIWNGSRWEKDTRESIIGHAREVADALDKVAEQLNDDKAKEAVEKWATLSRNVNRILAIPRIARTDERVKIPADHLDFDPFAFNVSNCTINLKTGGSTPHDKADFISLQSSAVFNPRAKSPLWDDYLKLVFDGNDELIDFAQRAVGYSLTGLTIEQCFFLMIGPQGTGKTTFIETVRALMGEYGKNADPSAFMEKPRSGRANPEIARLQGARFVSSSETEENERLATSLIKRLSGNTRITASHLYAPDFEFDPVMKIWIDTNNKPKIPAHDSAVWARLVLLPFEVDIRNTPRDIKGFKDILRTELSGILNWAIEGCLKWQQNGLRRPTIVENAANEYRDESDVLQAFLDDVAIVNPNERCTSSHLYAAYRRWCEQSGERVSNQRVFKARMQEKGFEAKRTTAGIEWFGVRPTTQAHAEPEPIRTQANPFEQRQQPSA